MVEESSFLKVFGNTPFTRVVDFFLEEGRYFDYSLTEIAKNSDVAWSTLHEIFPRLINLGIVKETRQIARAKLYKLNTDSPLVKELIRVDNEISKILMGRELEKQKISVQTD